MLKITLPKIRKEIRIMFTEKERPLCNRPGRALAALTFAVLCLAAPRPAAADVVTDWNAIALTTAVAAFPGNRADPPRTGRDDPGCQQENHGAKNATDVTSSKQPTLPGPGACKHRAARNACRDMHIE